MKFPFTVTLASFLLTSNGEATLKGGVLMAKFWDGMDVPVPSQKALKSHIQTRLRDETGTPLIFSAIALPGENSKIMSKIAQTSTGGKNLKMRQELAESVTVFLRDTLLDQINNTDREEHEIGDEVEESESLRTQLGVISDVPALMHLQLRLAEAEEGSETLPIIRQAREIEAEIIENLATISTDDLSDMKFPAECQQDSVLRKDNECDRLLIVEVNALTRLREVLEQQLPDVPTDSETEPPVKPVVLVALNQAMACYREHKDEKGMTTAMHVMQRCYPEKGMKIVLPTKNYASMDAAVHTAKQCCESCAKGRAQARKLMAVGASAPNPDVDYEAARVRVLQGVDTTPAPTGTTEAPGEPVDNSSYQYVNLERREIFIWTSIALGFAAFAAVYSTAFMSLNKDPLLYTKIYTGSSAPTN